MTGVTTHVNQYDEKYSRNGTLNSGGLGPCIAIAIYNRKTRHGFMIHHPNLDVDRILEDLLPKVISKLGRASSLKVEVAGCAVDRLDKVMDSKCLSARSYVEQQLQNNFLSENIRIEWSDPGDITELTLDTQSGIFSRNTEATEINLARKSSNNPDDYDSNGNPLIDD